MKRASLAAGRNSLLLTTVSAALCACTFDSLPAEPVAAMPEVAEQPAAQQPRDTTPESPTHVRRGLGTLTARVPGTDTVVGGVHLVSHHVRVVARDSFARTEIEEEFYNDTSTVLEGRYVFPLPSDASISRLALYVGSTLVEGELVEKRTAARIFRGIVDDTVRPRDPALLEWVAGGEFSLKIFPLPPRASRKLILAYDQVLASIEGRIGYSYPLSLGSDRANRIRDFSFHLTATESEAELAEPVVPRHQAQLTAEPRKLEVQIASASSVPESDIVVSYVRSGLHRASAAVYRPAKGEFGGTSSDGYFALRLRAPAHREGVSVARDRIIVLDRSYSQSADTLDAQEALAVAALQDLAEGEQFALLACDSACVSFPEEGTLPSGEQSRSQARAWMQELRPGGSSDLAGALVQSLRRARPGAQVVFMSDGQPSSGELTAAAIAEHVRPEAGGAQLRFVGAGRSVDEAALQAIARSLSGTYDRLMLQDAATIVRKLRSPVLVDAELQLPDGVYDTYPRAWGNVALGDEMLVVGRVTPAFRGGAARLCGTLQGAAYAAELSIEPPAAGDNPLVPRLWAQAALADLEEQQGAAAHARAIALSRSHHVLSRSTSLLVLENDAMFSEFGIAHPTRSAASQSDDAFMAGAHPEPRAARGAMMGERIADEYGPDGPVYHGRPRGGQGFGSGAGRLSSQSARVPMVRMGATTISGRLPAEVIQRIVRQQFGRLRTCYERGLYRNPNLTGRVAVRFVISRDGSVSHASNGGSDLTDNDVVGCMVAVFRAMQFPQPEGGIVTVHYPIMCSSDGTRPTRPPSPWPVASQPDRPMVIGPQEAPWQPRVTVSHRASDDVWRQKQSPELDALRKALLANERSRSAHGALVRGLLRFGGFDEAVAAAQRFVALDPDLPRARELLAQALAATGDSEAASRMVDTLAESAPSDAAVHVRAARGFEAIRAERRACAHWRSLAQLKPSDSDAMMQSLRCRARVLAETAPVLRELAALPAQTPWAASLAYQVRNGTVPAYDGSYGRRGTFEATATCGSGTAPAVILLTDAGSVIAPSVPSAARSGTSTTSVAVQEGTIRTLLVGGDCEGGEVELKAYGVVKKLAFGPGQGPRTVATSTIRSDGG